MQEKSKKQKKDKKKKAGLAGALMVSLIWLTGVNVWADEGLDKVKDDMDAALTNVNARVDDVDTRFKAWLVKTSGYAQMAWVSDPALAGKEPFHLKRFRVAFGGKLNDYTIFKIQPDFSGLASAGNVALREAWIDFIADKDLATFRVGQYHQPFGFENQYSSSRKKVFDTPFYMGATGPLAAAEYDYGVFWWGNLPGSLKDYLRWRVGVFNGTGNTTVDTNRTKDVAGQVVTNALGKEIEIGASVYMRSAGTSELSAMHVGAHVKAEMTAPFPWFFTSEYVGGRDSTGVTDQLDAILTWEGKPFVGMGVLSEVAPVIRYEFWDANVSLDSGNFTNWTVGFNFYPDKSVRFLVDYVIKNNPTNSATNRLNTMIQVNY